MSYTPADFRVDPIDGSIYGEQQTETHDIAELTPDLPGVYGVRLNEGIEQETLTVREDDENGDEYVQVTGSPLEGQVAVQYDDGIAQRGILVFNIADLGKTVWCQYNGVGTVANLDRIESIAEDAGAAAGETAAQEELSDLDESIDTRQVGTVRQTTVNGPRDASGNPELLDDDTTGLEISTVELDPGSGGTPWDVTIVRSAFRDRNVSITSNVTWSSLTDDTDPIILLARIESNGTVTPLTTTDIEFGIVRQSSPSSGSIWMPLAIHRQPQRYDGAAWQSEDLIFPAGQVTTSSGSITEVRTYAYNGVAIVQTSQEIQEGDGTQTLDHNLGAPAQISQSWLIASTGAPVEFTEGEVIPWFGTSGVDITGATGWRKITPTQIDIVNAGTNGGFIPTGTSNARTISTNSDRFFAACKVVRRDG